MFTEALSPPPLAIDPLDAVEDFADRADIASRRVDERELHLTVPGLWRDALLWFVWRAEFQTIQMGAALDLKCAPPKTQAVSRLVALVNEHLWIGHFDLWSEDGSIVYRYGAVLPDGESLHAAQVEVLIRNAVEAYERFYPAFHHVVWADSDPERALEAAMFETAGNA